MNSKPGQLVSIERSPERKPLRGGGQGRRGRDPLRRPGGGRTAGPGCARPPFYLCFSFPVNKFPRAVRANWPGSPKSGRGRAVPRLLCSVGAPGAGGFHTSREATARDPAGRALEPAPPQTRTPTALPPAQLREAPPAPLARPVPAPRPRPRPLRPPRTAPRPRHHPRAGPGAPWLQAARRASPRLPQRPRLLLRLLPRLADGACHQNPRRRGIWESSAACEELRPERAPPVRPSPPPPYAHPPPRARRPAPPARLRPPRRPVSGRGPPGAL
ncbi:proline-rich protein 2-like [Lutra lutra]|uniref:proline-rich protein 2-like n=1 Tax=Lutra lutra TaxID=9657 RepID=UPI001FD58EA6|nr:proline-rich protein 2-like [Lutra lutra]